MMDHNNTVQLLDHEGHKVVHLNDYETLHKKLEALLNAAEKVSCILHNIDTHKRNLTEEEYTQWSELVDLINSLKDTCFMGACIWIIESRMKGTEDWHIVKALGCFYTEEWAIREVQERSAMHPLNEYRFVRYVRE